MWKIIITVELVEKRPQNKNNDQSKNVDRAENRSKSSDSYLGKQSV